MSRDLMADLILVLHLLIVVFNVGALPVIWIGWLKRWRFVRNFYFRAAHLVLIGFVAVESVIGVACPLTTWEEGLRRDPNGGYEAGFVAHWVGRIIYYDFPLWVFTAAYVLFFLLVLGTWIWVRPERPRRVDGRLT